MSMPSGKAVQAAGASLLDTMTGKRLGSYEDHARHALAAAHDPALELDRSVCLRDVVDALRTYTGARSSFAADFVEHEFGGGPTP